MNYSKVLVGLTVALAAVPASSFAQVAYLSNQTELRAGPGVEYPEVAILPPRLAVSVQGCLNDYSWCDVLAGPSRGWVFAGYIAYPYQGTSVPVLTYGAMLGLGIAAFSVGHYWDSYYVGRPWYPQRQLWINRPTYGPYGHGRPPPGYRPPPGHGYPGYGHSPGYRPPGGHAPGYRPPGGHPPQLGPGGGHRPPQQHPGAGHRPPQQGPGGGQHRPPPGQGGGGGGPHQSRDHGQGGR